MKKIFNTFLLILMGFSVFGQTELEQFLIQIETNNLSLKSSASSVEAQKLENRTGLNPANPTIGTHYLWGSSDDMPIRNDFSVSQEIEFPTVYSNQKKLADIRDEQSDLEYRQHRLEILNEAAQLWAEMVSLNRSQQELESRLENAQGLADAYELMLQTGEANRIDRNKTALYLLQVEKELEHLKLDKQQVDLQISAMNGNQPLLVVDSEFLSVQLPASQEQWLNQMASIDPLLNYANLEIEAGERSEKIAQGKSLPSISGGYMLEGTSEENYQGVTLGLSIPLWENKNKVKAERAKTEAAILQEQNFRLQWESSMSRIYQQVESAQQLVFSYREELDLIQQKELLDEALSAGQISLIEYLMELQYNYDAIDQLMEAEELLQKAYVSMKVLEM